VRRLVFAVALVAAGTAAPQAGSRPLDLWAAPAGRGGACSRVRPCALSSAKSAARGSPGAVVHLGDGTYRLTAPLRFTAEDSGTSWVAAPGARPVISGAVRVTGWRPSSMVHGAWAAPARFRTRELYVDGVRASRTTGPPPPFMVQTADGYADPSGSMAGWRNPRDIELVFTGANGFWTQPRCDVASISPDGTSVALRQPCWSNLHIPQNFPTPAQDPSYDYDDNPMGGFDGITPVTQPSLVENAFENLDGPGQWYLDSSAHRVFYIPRPGEDMRSADVEAPVLERLVDGEGASRVTFSGITFAYTTWRQPSGDDGFAEMQANTTLRGPGASYRQGTCRYSDPPGTCPFASWPMQPAAVDLASTRGVRIVGDRFVHLGAGAVHLGHGSRGDAVVGNEIGDISGNGVMLGSTDDPTPWAVHAGPGEVSTGNVVRENWIHGVGAEYPGAVGIWLGYTRGSVVVNNQVDDVPYTGISIGWGGWHTDTLHLDNPNINADNVVADNLIFNYMQVLEDGGAIYTNGFQGTSIAHGLELRDNVAVNQGFGTDFVYYDDEGSSYITLDRNVEYGGAGLFANGGCNTLGHIVIDGNYWVRGFGGYICPPPPVDVTVRSHHQITDHPAPDDVPAEILTGAGLQRYRSLLDGARPEVTNCGPYQQSPAGGTESVVSGSGFVAGRTRVFFGAGQASGVRVLSPNYLVATAPPGNGLVDVTVTTPWGTSAVSGADQCLYAG
jgi:hypothetical protein